MEREGDLVYNEVHFPRVLGGECAGTIVTIGDSVERFAVGDRVYAQSFMNDKGGSYAEYVVVSEETVAPIPNGLDSLMAGGLCIAGVTALSNLQVSGTGNKTKLMLWGASGGVGHVALQLAKRMGANVFAIASGADGVVLTQQLGADESVDGHSDDVVQRARAFAPDGFDVALVLVGGDTVQSTLSLVRQGGMITFPNGVMPEPKAPDGVELKKANGVANRMLLDQLNRLIDIDEFQEPLTTLAELKKQGLIRHLGLSNVTPTQLTEAQTITEIVCVQNQYNVAHREDDAFIDDLAQQGIAYVPFFPLGGLTPLQSSVLESTAKSLNVTPIQVALAWLLQRSSNILLIPGTSSVEHLRQNVKAAALQLPQQTVADLNAIAAKPLADRLS